MHSKRRVLALLLTPLLMLALVLAYLSSWRTQVIRTSGADPFQVTFSPDGKYLAVAAHGPSGAHENGAINVWQVISPSLLRQARLLDRRQFKVYCPASLCFSGDSTRLICVPYRDGEAVAWSTHTGHRSDIQETSRYAASFAQPWPNKDTISYAANGAIEQQDTSHAQIRNSPKVFGGLQSSQDATHSGYGTFFAFAPSGQFIAWASSPYNSSVINGVQLTSVSLRQTRLLAYEDCTADRLSCDPTALAVSPDSRFVVVARARTFSRQYQVLNTSHLTMVWNVKTRSIACQWPEESGVNAFAFSPDGRTIAEAHKNGSVHLRDAATSKLLRTFKAHHHDAMSVAFSPDGTLLASCGGDGTLRLTRVR